MTQGTKISSKEFASLLLQHQRKLTVLLRCLVFEKQAIPDLLQEVNVLLLDKEDEYDPEYDFFPWASMFARFVAKSYLRDQNRSKMRLDDQAINNLLCSSEQYLDGEEYEAQRQMLRSCVEKLPKKHKSIFDLHYAQKLKPSQIAGKLQKKPNAIRQILHRIRLVIIQCVEKAQADRL